MGRSRGLGWRMASSGNKLLNITSYMVIIIALQIILLRSAGKRRGKQKNPERLINYKSNAIRRRCCQI